tara:strand:+ start:22 stop:1209 length:1188 start_codon:yes stop_codon:yes gene_type:complete
MVDYKSKYLKYKTKYNKLIAGSNSAQQCFNFYHEIYKEIKDIQESDKIIRTINTVITPELFNICIGNLNFELSEIENIELSRTKLQIYNMNLAKLVEIDVDIDDLLYYKSMYNIPFDINEINEGVIYSINQYIRNHIISPQDIHNQYIYYNNLNDFSKKMYIMQKQDPDYLRIYRNKSYTNEEFKELSGLNTNALQVILFNKELERYDNLGNEMMKPFLKCFNNLFNIFEYSPPTTKSFYVYRAEKIWNNIINIIDNFSVISTYEQLYYRFNGFTSTSCDPRIGFSFNKLSSVCDNDRIIFKILIPEGSKIIIPSVYNNFDDAEFEVLLGSDAIIKINNIKKDKIYKYLISPTNEENHNCKNTRHIKYFIEAEFLEYDNTIYERYPNESVFTLPI